VRGLLTDVHFLYSEYCIVLYSEYCINVFVINVRVIFSNSV
jgi:hypothetical protein